MKNKVILLTVGGFHEIIELCEAANIEVVGIIDEALQAEYMGYRVLGKDSEAAKVFDGYPEIPIAITPDSPAVRKRLSIYYSEIGFKFISLIHPDSAISKHSRIGHGTVIQRGAHISSNTTVGNFVKVNTRANITHDVQIGDFATIAPSAVILSRSIVSGIVLHRSEFDDHAEQNNPHPRRRGSRSSRLPGTFWRKRQS